MKPLRVFLVATDDHLAAAFKALTYGTTRHRKRKTIIFTSFTPDSTYEPTDLITLETSRADLVLIGISYPANLHGIPEEAIRIAREEGKPHGVYLEHPELFCENGFKVHAPQLSWILIPDDRHHLPLAKISQGVAIHVTGTITEPHRTTHPFCFHRSGLSALVRTLKCLRTT